MGARLSPQAYEETCVLLLGWTEECDDTETASEVSPQQEQQRRHQGLSRAQRRKLLTESSSEPYNACCKTPTTSQCGSSECTRKRTHRSKPRSTLSISSARRIALGDCLSFTTPVTAGRGVKASSCCQAV